MTETTSALEGDRGVEQGRWITKRIFAIVGASSGNLVEWFDFTFTPSAQSTLPPHFSGGQQHHAAAANRRGIRRRLLYATYRRLAVRLYCRQTWSKNSMLLSVCMMCAGSLVIACLPTYEAIGSWAPALLLLARLFQGLSVGGEYGTSATYMSEVAIKGRRGFMPRSSMSR